MAGTTAKATEASPAARIAASPRSRTAPGTAEAIADPGCGLTAMNRPRRATGRSDPGSSPLAMYPGAHGSPVKRPPRPSVRARARSMKVRAAPRITTMARAGIASRPAQG